MVESRSQVSVVRPLRKNHRVAALGLGEACAYGHLKHNQDCC